MCVLPSLALVSGCPLDFSSFACLLDFTAHLSFCLLDFAASLSACPFRLYHSRDFAVMSISKDQDLMYVETGDEDQWRITALSSDAEGGYSKKKEASKADDPTKDPPTDDLTSGIERLALEESTHVVSKDQSPGSVEPLPSHSSSEPSHVDLEHDLTAAKPLPPSFSDAPLDKESRKEDEVMPSQEKVQEKELKKEDAPMASEEEQGKDKSAEDVTFESLPDKPSEVMEPDFSPDGDEEMAQQPLPDLQDASVDKDISLGAKPKSAPTSRPSLEMFSRKKSLLIADGVDSDSNAPRALPPPLNDALPGRSSLRTPSRAKSRPPSRSRGHSRSRHEDRSRSRASPERRIMDGKAKVVTVSGHAPSASGPLPLTAPRASQPPLRWMPEDVSHPCFREDFVRWTALSLQRDWSGDSRCWPNVHIGLYLYESSAEWPCAHPRCLAAGALSQDESLDEPWICWACFKPAGPGALQKRPGVLKLTSSTIGTLLMPNHCASAGRTLLVISNFLPMISLLRVLV